MPDRHTKVETLESGEIKVTMPAQSPKAQPTDTHLQVNPGTDEHEALVSDVPHSELPPDVPNDRRRAVGPIVNVQQPQTGGLTGPWAIGAQVTAIGLIFGIVIFQMYESRADKREMFNQLRDERRQDRSEEQAATAATVGALGSLAAAQAASVVSINALMEEVRRERAENRKERQELMAVLKNMGKDKPDPEMGLAPMPRAVRAGAG